MGNDKMPSVVALSSILNSTETNIDKTSKVCRLREFSNIPREFIFAALDFMQNSDSDKLKQRLEYFFIDFIDKFLNSQTQHLTICDCYAVKVKGNQYELISYYTGLNTKDRSYGILVSIDTSSKIYYNMDIDDTDEDRNLVINSLIFIDRISDRLKRMYPGIYTRITISNDSNIKILVVEP